jgi:exosortase A-associated hydrolase 2
LLAVRTGYALAAKVARDQCWRLSRTVFWQPVIDGERFLTQFLRLRVAASLMESGHRASAEELRKRLQAGETLEIAGYEVSPPLATQIAQVKLAAELDANLGAVDWIEIVRADDQPLAQNSQDVIGEAQGRGITIHPCTVKAEPFWSSTEIVLSPVLVNRTINLFCTP